MNSGNPCKLCITVREPATGAAIYQIDLQLSSFPVISDDMLRVTQDAGTQKPGKDAGPVSQSTPAGTSDIAGKLTIQPHETSKAITAYLTDLTARGKTKGTLKQYGALLRRMMQTLGVAHPSQISYNLIQNYCGSQPTWSAGTQARAMKVASLFTQYCLLSRVIDHDPLVGARGHVNIEAPGSRAATLAEAQAFLAHAAATVMTDARAAARCNRAVYYLCLFAAGCRANEPGRWRWKNLALDHATPHILWTAGKGDERTHKNNRIRAIALAPELVQALNLWRDQSNEMRRNKGLPKAKADDKVFPSQPINATFRADRENTGIDRLDFRGRAFTAHSARKFLATQLTTCGVAEKMVDFLMRHTGRTEYRYYDPSLEEQAAAIAKLPKLLPEFFFTANLRDAKLLRAAARKNAKTPLDKEGVMVDDISVKATSTASLQSQLTSNAGPNAVATALTIDAISRTGPALDVSGFANTASASSPAKNPPFPPKNCINSGYRVNETGENELVADLLEALARLIRGSVGNARREEEE